MIDQTFTRHQKADNVDFQGGWTLWLWRQRLCAKPLSPATAAAFRPCGAAKLRAVGSSAPEHTLRTFLCLGSALLSSWLVVEPALPTRRLSQMAVLQAAAAANHSLAQHQQFQQQVRCPDTTGYHRAFPDATCFQLLVVLALMHAWTKRCHDLCRCYLPVLQLHSRLNICHRLPPLICVMHRWARLVRQASTALRVGGRLHVLSTRVLFLRTWGSHHMFLKGTSSSAAGNLADSFHKLQLQAALQQKDAAERQLKQQQLRSAGAFSDDFGGAKIGASPAPP